jgi:ABC-type Fe3+ transport system substrate-binding protein
MKSQRFAQIAAIAILGSLIAAGCGDDDDGGQGAQTTAAATTVASSTGAPATTRAGADTSAAATTSAATAAGEPWKCVDPTAEEPAPGTEFVWGFGGGTTGEHAMAEIVPAFEAASGLKVNYVGASSAETMAKVIGANGDAGFDIIMQPFAVLQNGRKAGVLSEIDYATLPEMEDIPDDALDPVSGARQAVAINQFGYGVAYNTDTLQSSNMPVPDSIEDLFDPVYGDKVGIYSPPYSTALAQLAVVNALAGGDPSDWTGAIDRFAEMRDRAKLYGEQSEIAAGVAQGDVGIWFETTSIANNFKDQGLPIEMVFGDQAPVAYVLAAIPTGTKDKGAPACVFLNWAMSAEGQKLFSENGKNNPVKPGVPTPDGSVMPSVEGLDLLNVGLLLDNPPNSESVTEQWNMAFG